MKLWKSREQRSRFIVWAGVGFMWGSFIVASIVDWDWRLALTFGLIDAVITVLFLWPYRRRQLPQFVVSLHDPRAMSAARRQMARRRPWLWGLCRHLWVYSFHRLDFPLVAGPTYRWKTRTDRRIERDLNQCCGVPEGQSCPSHEERS